MKRVLFPLVLYLSILPSAAQDAATDPLYQKVEAFGRVLPQEKVYLHLDNTCYFLGDTIWYKGYVTQGNTGTLTSLSRILYVELLTPDGYLVERQQLEMPDGMANGMFVLTDSLYAGYYELRAYTRWMLNFGQREHPHGGWIVDAFYNADMARDFLRDYDKLYSRVFPVYDKPEEEGRFPKDMTVRPLRRYYKTRSGKPETDLRFYPEGGQLVAGTDGRVALELNTEEGEHLKGVDITIRDKDKQEVARCRTDERGRAVFTLRNISPSGGYQAVFSLRGNSYEKDLPEVAESGCALTVVQDDSAVVARVQAVDAEGPLALHVMSQGVSRFYQPLNGETSVSIPLDSLPTGVNQLTVFNAEGRIYADRLFFVNHHDYDAPRLAVSGIRTQYEPFDSITLRLQLSDPTDSVAGLSLSVRDRATEELTYDNGTMLTEMLLASEIRGFVENPGYYFEADDSIRRRALDLLLMVQGWRRYEWRTMAGIEPFEPQSPPETRQTLNGSVHRGYSLFPDNEPGERSFITTLMKTDLTQPIDFNTTENCAWEYRGMSLQQIYGTLIPKMDKEANIFASFSQGEETLNQMAKTENGSFCIPTPKLYGNYILELTGTDADIAPHMAFTEKYSKGFNDETAEPLFYVKLDHFFPKFPKPYSYYQDASILVDSAMPSDSLSFTNRRLPAVQVSTKKGGLRKLDRNKPAVVMDAYDAFNLAADYGLNGGKHDWRTFSQQVAVATVADMGLDRRYFIQEQYNGKAQNLKANENVDWRNSLRKHEWDVEIEVPQAKAVSISKETIKKYRLLRNLDKLYIYTDYAPREQGSWRYEQSNQPEVIIDYRLFPDGGYQRTYRDRHYVLRGYAVCDDFYSPDYSRRPLPDVKDHRRTLLWMPDVKFDKEGKATVRLYNNSKPTAISIEAEGITRNGKPIQFKSNGQ